MLQFTLIIISRESSACNFCKEHKRVKCIYVCFLMSAVHTFNYQKELGDESSVKIKK